MQLHCRGKIQCQVLELGATVGQFVQNIRGNQIRGQLAKTQLREANRNELGEFGIGDLNSAMGNTEGH